MTKTKNQKMRAKQAKKQVIQVVAKTKPNNKKKKKQPQSLFRSVGSSLAQITGIKPLAAVGTGLSRLFGQGDYRVQQNSLMSGGVPTFSSLTAPLRFQHKELLGIVNTSTTYNVSLTAAINPGTMTPILAQLASTFTMYKFHGLCFYFNSSSADSVSSTNTALGITGMVVNYDPTAPKFSSRQAAEEYIGSQSASPATNLILPVECKPQTTALEKRFVRGGVSNKTLVETDLGLFQFFSDGVQAASVAGEIWVSYDIELFLPKINNSGSSFMPDVYRYVGNIGNGTQFGSVLQPVKQSSTLLNQAGNNGLDFLLPGTYMVFVTSNHSNNTAASITQTVYGGTATTSILSDNTAASLNAPEVTVSSAGHAYCLCYTVPTASTNGLTYPYPGVQLQFASLTQGATNVYVYVHRISALPLSSIDKSLQTTVQQEMQREMDELKQKFKELNEYLQFKLGVDKDVANLNLEMGQDQEEMPLLQKASNDFSHIEDKL